MNSFNPILIRSVAVSTIAAAALASLVGCGPQSGATTAPPATPNVAAQQQNADPAYPGPNAGVNTTAPAAPNYVANNGVPPPPNRAGQAVPVNGYSAQPGVAPAQAYAPPTQVAQQVAPAAAPRAPNPALHGEVSGIEPIRSRPQGNGTGAVIGGVLGAVVGNQFGHGNGRAALTVLGAGGGAVAGNNVERNMSEKVTGYRVSVRLDNGQVRTYEESSVDGLRVGDRVRIDGHRVVRT